MALKHKLKYKLERFSLLPGRRKLTCSDCTINNCKIRMLNAKMKKLFTGKALKLHSDPL